MSSLFRFTTLLALFIVVPALAKDGFTTVMYPVDPQVFAVDGLGSGGDDPFGGDEDPFGGDANPFGADADPFGAPHPLTHQVLGFFAGLMDFPADSKVDYIPMLGKIRATTSPDAHAQIKAILEDICPAPAMVSIDYTLISLPTNVVLESEEYRATGSLSNEEVMRLFRAGHAKLISLSKVVTLSGVNAQVESVEEIIYPTEFDIEAGQWLPSTKTAGAAVTPPCGSVPGAFETRETGFILNVTPTIAPGLEIINLALIPEKAELIGWIDYDAPGQREVAPERKSRQSQPVFRSRNLTTSLVVFDGQPAVTGGAPHPETGELLYGIITARVIKVKKAETK